MILLCYVAIAVALLVMLPPDAISGLTGSTEALREGGNRLGGPNWGLGLSAVMGLCLAVGNVAGLSAWLGATARLPFVVGLDRYLPPAFGLLHRRWRTPYVSLSTLSAVSAFFVILSGIGGRAEQMYEMLVSLEISVGNRMLLSGLAFFVMAAVFLLASRTEQSELNVKEKMLEIEYRLAELAEKVDPSRKGP